MTAISFEDLDYQRRSREKPLTARQERILQIVRRHWREHHYSPTFRDIAAAMGISKGGGITYSLDQLEELGHVRLERHPSGLLRAIVPIGDSCPCCGRSS